MPSPARRSPPTPPPPDAVPPRRPRAPQTQRIAAAPPQAAPVAGPRPTERSKHLRLAGLVACGAAVLAGGLFAGLTIFGSDDPSSGDGRADDDAAADGRPSLLPSVSDTEMTSQIREMFATYYRNIVDGDLDTAFALLSARKQNTALRRSGLDGWKRAQAGFVSYLDSSGLQVQMDYADPATGVVRVRLSGMAYTNPASSCTTWSGITWVKYEKDAFHYDPGYSTTPQRTRDWKDRESELLGIGC